LIENVHAQTKDELFLKEAFYIRTLKNLNVCIPNRNSKEYYIDNKEIIDDKNKQWRENNKAKYNSVCLNASKKYQEEHKTEIQEYKKQYWINKKDLYKTETAILRKILI
jgi:hypothetical protein